ncbi:MAG: acyl-homoserine-lactone acylase [Hyphomicrobiales bacterium]|nr:MAG: acyl-homoserine-lactone acylase [Hyphomicrobiales bacterium]
MKTAFKYLSYLVGFFMVILLIAALSIYVYFTNGLPLYDGQVQLAGSKHKITITRDQYALPHIIAQTTNDAYFAIGYAHAQDRLFQMQLHRHIAMGRLSELVGQKGLETDKFLRTLGMFQAAQSSYKLLSSQTKAELDAYSAGVNAYLAEDNILPVEFAILQLDKPAPWQPIHSVAWMKIMAWDLNNTWRKELDRLIMSATFTPQQIAEYHHPYPGDKPFIPPKPIDIYGFELNSPNPMQTSALSRRISISPIIDQQTAQGIGSNNWVLAGNLSQSGKPLLANDPHLGLTAPALWYHAHLKAEDDSLNAIGATMPGVPYIILGRNDRIAWGFTNTDPDAQDLYVEKITRDGFYKTPNGEAPFITRQEVIKIKGQNDYILTTRSTRHGPVLSDRLNNVATLLGDKHVIALRWTALDDDSTSIEAAAKMAASQNWQQFKAATKAFKAPQQSIVYADVDGNIGFIAPGAVPIRHADNELYGQYPSPGWLAKYDWQGYIPFDELPQKFNPTKNYIATANHKIIDDDYKHYIASKWSLPYRYDRIVKLLEAKQKHSLDSLKDIQFDQYSNFLEAMRPLLDQAMTLQPLTDSDTIKAYQLIKNWDGHGTVDSREMLLITLWIRNLQTVILTPEFDQLRSRNHQFLIDVLNDKNGMSRWCGTLGNQDGTPQTCATLVSQTFYITTQQIIKQLGINMKNWQWGKVHQAVSEHRIFNKVPLLNRLFNLTTPVGGGRMTINVGTFGRTDSDDLNQIFKNTVGPSLRHLFDLSDLEKSRYIHSSGQSGNVFSPYYDDYMPLWAKGDFIPMTMLETNYLPNAIGSLELIPK